MAVGEIGYDDQTVAEDKFYRAQLALAKELDMLVLVHTPHRDKKSGTTRSMGVAVEMGMAPARVIIDDNNEETVQEVLDRGFWAAFTIYPHTKMGKERMVEIVRRYGSERIIVDSSADWGVSDPLVGTQDRAPDAGSRHPQRGCRGHLLRPEPRSPVPPTPRCWPLCCCAARKRSQPTRPDM